MILNQAANVHCHGLGLRKSSDNTNVSDLAHRIHVLVRSIGIVPENAVDYPGLLLEIGHSSYVAVKVEKWP